MRVSPRAFAGAVTRAAGHDVSLLASALAFSAFLAIPATLLLVVGLFSLVAEPSLIDEVTERLATVVPDEAVTLVDGSLRQLEREPSAGLVMTVAGFALALWTTTGAATVLMQAVNRAHELEDKRGFLRRRLVALVLVAFLGFALLAVAALLVLGPHLQRWVGEALGAEDVVGWIWRAARWPVLLVVLLAAFSAVYALATDRRSRRWRVLSPGAATAALLWLAGSWAFGLYAAHFGSYNKTWGSLSAAIVTMVWLWLSSLALLYGAEIDAETERVGERAAAGLSDTGEGTRASPTRRAA